MTSDAQEPDRPKAPEGMMQREDSLGELPSASSAGQQAAQAEEEAAVYTPTARQQLEDDLNLPPGRMHATRVKERLSGSGQLNIPPGLASVLAKKRLEGSVPQSPRSRSRSPSLKDKITAGTTDANSSISSLDDIVDQDILLDRAGVIDGVAEEERSHGSRGHKLHNSSSECIKLPPVSERMSEETLEDVHAFSDAAVVRQPSSNASRANSIATGNNEFLEPLTEEDEMEDDLDGIPEHEEGAVAQVILTNLDNISLNDDANDADRRAGTRGTGGSSLLEEAPSAPTA